MDVSKLLTDTEEHHVDAHCIVTPSPHHRQDQVMTTIATLQWTEGPNLDNASLSYSDLHNVGNGNSMVPVLFLDATFWGDYCGDIVTRANFNHLRDTYGRAQELREVCDTYGSSGYVLTLDAGTVRFVRSMVDSWGYESKRDRDRHADGFAVLQHMIEGDLYTSNWGDPDPTMRQNLAHGLIGLEDYPLFDDESHSMLEMQLATEAWESYVESDMRLTIYDDAEAAREDSGDEIYLALDGQADNFRAWFFGVFLRDQDDSGYAEGATGFTFHGMDDAAAHVIAETWIATGKFPWQS